MTDWCRVCPGTAPPRRLTADDVEYLDGALRNAYGVFVDDPATGLAVARTMAASVLNQRGFDAEEVLSPFQVPPASDPDPEEIRQTLADLAATLAGVAVDGDQPAPGRHRTPTQKTDTEHGDASTTSQFSSTGE